VQAGEGRAGAEDTYFDRRHGGRRSVQLEVNAAGEVGTHSMMYPAQKEWRCRSRSARRSGPFIKGEISAADRAGLSPILHDLWHHDGLRRKWSSAEELLEPVHGGRVVA